MGRSFSYPQKKELREYLDKTIDLARSAEKEGYVVETLFSTRGIDLTRDGKNYHGNPLTGELRECIPDPMFPRAETDGRCLCCEGWGCCACGHTGGY